MLTQVDDKGRLPPLQGTVGSILAVAFLIGMPAIVIGALLGLSNSVYGPFVMIWALVGWAIAIRQYQWLTNSAEFNSLARS